MAEACLLFGKVAPSDHHEELYFSYTGVSVGTKRDALPYPMRAFRTRRFKYIRVLRPEIGHPKQGGALFPAEQLYDLDTDPEERENLAGDRRLASVQAELSDQVDAWMARTNDQGVDSELETLRRYEPRDRE